MMMTGYMQKYYEKEMVKENVNVKERQLNKYVDKFFQCHPSVFFILAAVGIPAAMVAGISVVVSAVVVPVSYLMGWM